MKKEISDLLYQYLISSSTKRIEDVDLLQMNENALKKYVNQDYEYWTERFIKVFEKLIDSIYQSEDMNYHGDEMSWGIDKFYDKIKEELTK